MPPPPPDPAPTSSRTRRRRRPRPREGPRGALDRWRGPLPTWPGPVERLAEAWWRLPARLRLLAVVVLVGLVAAGAARRATRTPWGPPVPVVVATADTAPGDAVTSTVRPWPAALVPDDALATPPARAVATRALRADAVLTRGDVADDLDDLLGAGEVAVALAQALPDLPTDARVVLLGTGMDGTGVRLAGGRLLARSADWAWVAVDRDAAPAVAAAMTTGQVTVALAPP